MGSKLAISLQAAASHALLFNVRSVAVGLVDINPPLLNNYTSEYTVGRYEISVADAEGDLNRVHQLYCSWITGKKPDPVTGELKHGFFHLATEEAATQGKGRCLNYLLLRATPYSSNIISAAVKSKSTEVLEGLLANGWGINEPRSHDEPPWLLYATSLHINVHVLIVIPCCAVKDEDLVRWFLDHGADPNAPAREWQVTPLSWAVSDAPLSTIKLLFDHGGSAPRGQLVLHAAERKDPASIAVLQYLVDRGAPTNEWLFETLPEIHNWSAVNLGNTPLPRAASAGCIENVRFLLANGADPTKRGCPLRTRVSELPIEAARRRSYDDVIQLLTEAMKPAPSSRNIWAFFGWK
ncbi:MAG: hypothetical protein Q9169_005559 [Polycauliona sp. 2 TL-2023]